MKYIVVSARWLHEKLQQSFGFWIFLQMHQGNILRRRRGVSRFTYIFSISSNGRLEPSGMLTNFQPPPPPRLPRGPSFSTVNFQPSLGRRLLYLWHCTMPAICGKKTTSLISYNRGKNVHLYKNWTVDKQHIERRKDKENTVPCRAKNKKIQFHFLVLTCHLWCFPNSFLPIETISPVILNKPFPLQPSQIILNLFLSSN